MSIFAIIFAILIFGFLIFIHEFGHFITAKLSGVQVNEFAIFMGPAIWKKQKGETLYSIRCIPLGGYCAMEGEDGDSDNPRAFSAAAWWKRLCILLAGAFMNFVAGLLILLIVFAPAKQVAVPVIVDMQENCTLAGENGLQVGDRFLEIDGSKILLQQDFSTLLVLNPGEVHDVVIERNGEKIVLEDFVMKKAEFPDGNGGTYQGFGFSFGAETLTFGGKLQYVWYNAIDWIRSVGWSLEMLFTGKAGLSDLSGPVGIVQQMGEAAEAGETWVDGVMNVLYFGAFLAVNLAVMNLLPIPALDGGRAVCLLLTTGFEAVTKKKINPKYEGYLHAAGMILLLGLMGIIMFKDIIFIFIKG